MVYLMHSVTDFCQLHTYLAIQRNHCTCLHTLLFKMTLLNK